MTVRDIIILGCSSQQPTRMRNHGAYLVRWNDEGLLFDPGEGTQRQFIFANVAPTVVTRIFVSHFHGDHCLGLGSVLMRLNLDKVTHPIHCYYPASGKRFFDRLRYGTIYHELIHVVEHPVSKGGLVHDDGKFRIEAVELDHGVENLGWRITEPDTRKYERNNLQTLGVKGPLVRELEQKGFLVLDGKTVTLDQVSHIRKGDSLAVVIDTRYCQNAIDIARHAKVLICESTYLEEHQELARKHFHLTAKQAATIAKEAGVKQLILTHFSARYQNLRPFEEEARAVFPQTYIADDLLTFPFPKNL
ncbi:ribonuclease Z [Neochlamydia sp. AcF95]|uniref:ribonuclease Z n=1 Tax=Neochlamydia sp. AcF95 TaxID=2795734 RepID=UPI001BC90B01|nr:ribonuclease Z [Neochlamydia sp. AcF95]MBS4169578.1 Ribonuclease Z [Neochlamydia sp. AcF95]